MVIDCHSLAASDQAARQTIYLVAQYSRIPLGMVDPHAQKLTQSQSPFDRSREAPSEQRALRKEAEFATGRQNQTNASKKPHSLLPWLGQSSAVRGQHLPENHGQSTHIYLLSPLLHSESHGFEEPRCSPMLRPRH